MNTTHLFVEAEVRYWEDTSVNEQDDADGSLIPLRRGALWCPVINLETGKILGWPVGTTADVHYKVCDQGEYWLGDGNTKSLKWRGHYVPDDFLCVGDSGYGDYIIFKVNADGLIQDWVRPDIDLERWKALP